jgi:hypothetical protein
MKASERSDFFVSYNAADCCWAEWIAWQLEDAGYSTKIQAWDFRPGGNFVLSMHAALAAADRILIVLSDNFLKSEFTHPEWASVFADDPKGSGCRIVPVKVAEVAKQKLPGLFSILPVQVYVNEGCQ